MIVADPVHAAQRTFRALLAALAHPGRTMAIDERIDAPAELPPALAAAALTLLDHEVTVWLAPHTPPAVRAWLAAATNCRFMPSANDAAFAVVLDARDALPLERWNSGTALDPEQSTTLLIGIEALSGGAARVLAGPGIERTACVAPRGVPVAFWPQWAANAATYPLGVDCFFFGEHDVLGLPRTTVEQPV